MADTLNVDVFSMTLLPTKVPIIYMDHPVYGVALTENQLRQLIQMPNYNIYEAGTRNRVDGSTLESYFPHGGGGGGGTTNYNDLINKPQINGATLRGNLSLSDIGALQLPSNGEVGQPIVVKSLKNNKPHDVECKDYDPYNSIEIYGGIKE